MSIAATGRLPLFRAASGRRRSRRPVGVPAPFAQVRRVARLGDHIQAGIAQQARDTRAHSTSSSPMHDGALHAQANPSRWTGAQRGGLARPEFSG